MTFSKEVLGLAGLGLINMLMLAAAWGKLQQALTDLQRDTDKRLARIEAAVGIATGETPFMRRTECVALDTAIRSDIKDVKERLTGLEAQVHQLVMRG